MAQMTKEELDGAAFWGPVLVRQGWFDEVGIQPNVGRVTLRQGDITLHVSTKEFDRIVLRILIPKQFGPR